MEHFQLGVVFQLVGISIEYGDNIYIYCLVGGFNPSEKYESQLG